MAKPSTRQGLIDYCLRRLGQPVVEINIDEDQLEERVDDALEFFQEYHFDGTERAFHVELVTPSTLTFAGASTGTFTDGEKIEILFNDSGSPALIRDPADFDSIYVIMPMKG